MTKQMILNTIETLEEIENIKINLNFNRKNLEDEELFKSMQ
jgi:nitrate reductase NapAB chaperone NapD